MDQESTLFNSAGSLKPSSGKVFNNKDITGLTYNLFQGISNMNLQI